MLVNNSRCYGEKIAIDNEEVKSFWDERALLSKNLNAVLLGNQKTHADSDYRNKKEFEMLKSVIKNFNGFSILDIGCGMGRWANNFKFNNCTYTGIDFSEKFIEQNKKLYKNMKFYVMSAENMDLSKLDKFYDLVLINGVLMYINDNELSLVFENVKKLNPKYIYLQESISIINERLTLNKFYSEELNRNYSSIYRVPKDYEYLIKEYFKNYKLLQSNLLLDKKSGAREETNAKYWVLKRGNDDRE